MFILLVDIIKCAPIDYFKATRFRKSEVIYEPQ